jgi:hypothetical protein
LPCANDKDVIDAHEQTSRSLLGLIASRPEAGQCRIEATSDGWLLALASSERIKLLADRYLRREIPNSFCPLTWRRWTTDQLPLGRFVSANARTV